MGLETSCSLWQQFENGSLSSSIGPDGTELGSPTYSPVKFNNGIFVDANSECAEFPLTLTNAGVMEWWIKLDGWSITNGTGSLNYCRLFHFVNPTMTSQPYIQYYNGFGIWHWSGNGVTTNWFFNGSEHDLANATLAHLMYVWDINGIGGGANIRRVYINGTLVDSSNASIGSVSGDNVNALHFGTSVDHIFPSRAYHDNLKMYMMNAVSEQFILDVVANMNNEAFLGAPQNVEASDGTYPNKIEITWDSVTGVDTFSVLRSDSATGSFLTISSWQTDTSYDDNNVGQGTFWYKVQSRDTSGTEGELSDSDSGYEFGIINKLIGKSKSKVFRRLWMKRRINGVYEASWQKVPDRYIMKFGTINTTIDDIKPNFLKYSGLTFQVQNDEAYFSEVDNNKSFFNTADSRYRTMVKIEAGYIDTDTSEYPSNPSLYIGILGEDMNTTERNEISFKTKHISGIFDEVPASDISGFGATLTASEVMTQIKNHTDGAGNAIFQNYITVGGWFITSTTDYYDMSTNSTLQGISCWQLMRNLAEAENKIMYIDLVGDFYFTDKVSGNSNSSFHFHGLGDTERLYGHNVKTRIKIDDGLNKVFNRVLVKSQKAETLSSYSIKSENWTWGDSSSSYIHGVRTYKYKNIWIQNSTTADDIAERIYDEYKNPRKEIHITSKFVPQLEVNNIASMKYSTKVNENPDKLWNYVLWDNFTWGENSGFNVDINGEFRVIKMSHNLDTFESKEILREI